MVLTEFDRKVQEIVYLHSLNSFISPPSFPSLPFTKHLIFGQFLRGEGLEMREWFLVIGMNDFCKQKWRHVIFELLLVSLCFFLLLDFWLAISWSLMFWYFTKIQNCGLFAIFSHQNPKCHFGSSSSIIFFWMNHNLNNPFNTLSPPLPHQFIFSSLLFITLPPPPILPTFLIIFSHFHSHLHVPPPSQSFFSYLLLIPNWIIHPPHPFNILCWDWGEGNTKSSHHPSFHHPFVHHRRSPVRSSNSTNGSPPSVP